MRWGGLVALLALAACGRTGLLEDADGGGLDAGLKPTGPRDAPLFVAVEDGACAKAGAEDDLQVQGSGERLVLMRSKANGECSGAGGEYLIGAEVGTSRDAFLGAHACYFLSEALRQTEGQVYWGVTRLSQTAALFRTPEGWCITSLSGQEPVVSDSKVKAWALYGSEAAAREAWSALSQP